MDSSTALYRTKIQSKKWYLRIFFHLMDMLCFNAWLLYRRDHKAYGQPKREQSISDCSRPQWLRCFARKGQPTKGNVGNQVLESFSLNLRGKGIREEQQCHILRSGKMALPTGLPMQRSKGVAKIRAALPKPGSCVKNLRCACVSHQRKTASVTFTHKKIHFRETDKMNFIQKKQ